MAYTINKFNGEELTVLQDGAVDVSTSLQLVGRSYVGYGEIQNENFVFLMENFANPRPPVRPLKGQTWFDTDTNLLNVYDGVDWQVIGAALVSETPPEAQSQGSFWFKSISNTLYVWNGQEWAFIGPETAEGFGVTRARTTTLLDTENQPNPVILLTVNDQITSIISSREFSIAASNKIQGFDRLVVGTTVSTLAMIQGNLKGKADRADRLEVARRINGIPFNATSDITIKAVTPNSLTAGPFITGSKFDGESAVTWSVDAASENFGGKIVARNSAGGFAAGLITATFSGNLIGNVTATEGVSKFNVIEANTFIGATLTGNSNTTTRLRTSRNINGVPFDGTQDITVTASAQTLTGTFLNGVVKTSQLEKLGTLTDLKILDSGASIGADNQLTLNIESAKSTIRSKTDLKLTSGLTGPDLIFASSELSLNEGGPAAPAILSNNLTNIGGPTKQFDQIFANNLRGTADNSIESQKTLNIKGGNANTLVYQVSEDLTGFVAPGAPGQVLTSLSNSTIQWRDLQTLIPGDFIVGDLYNGVTDRTWSVNATANNQADTVIARDSQGNFSANTITSNLTGNVSGNSTTATRLQTPRLINGVPFDGSSNITIDVFGGFGKLKAFVVLGSGTGSLPIVNSLNVVSVSRGSAGGNASGTGQYTVNFVPGTFLNENYVVLGMASDTDHFVVYRSSTANQAVVFTVDNNSSNNTTQATSGRVLLAFFDQ